jgi:hypothetical protein
MTAQMEFITSRAHFTNGSILLRYWQKETEPNQTLEPTTLAGTLYIPNPTDRAS